MSNDLYAAHLLSSLRNASYNRTDALTRVIVLAIKIPLLVGSAWVASRYGFLPGSFAVVLAAIL